MDNVVPQRDSKYIGEYVSAKFFGHKILEYYKKRGLLMPNIDQAFIFMVEEIGEVARVLNMRETGWTRNSENNPEYSSEKLGYELADLIMMAMVCGFMAGVNPLSSLLDKMAIKLAEMEKADEKKNKK